MERIEQTAGNMNGLMGPYRALELTGELGYSSGKILGDLDAITTKQSPRE